MLEPLPLPLEPAALHAASPRASLPAFLIGQDHLGRWVALATHGRAGGLFRSRRDALHYAEGETGRRPDAVALSAEPIEFRI
ncbi:hypothetical protein [Methylobacterium sp. JK268]